MIDIHCHILPGIDHGPKTLAESLQMAQQAAKSGIHTVVATPHHRNDLHAEGILDILQAITYINEKLHEENIPVQVLAGQEIRIYGEIASDLKNGKILPLNEQTKYISLELPRNEVPSYVDQVVYSIQMEGYVPIISHPETNATIQDNPHILYEMVRDGAIVQIAAPSVTGKNGKKVQKFTRRLLEANLVHCIGSNAYNSTNRGFHLKEAVGQLNKMDRQLALQLMQNNEKIIKNQNVTKQEPTRLTNKRWLF